MSDSLAVQHYVPAQTLQCYLDSLLQEAAADLALAEQSMPDVPVSPSRGTHAAGAVPGDRTGRDPGNTGRTRAHPAGGCSGARRQLA